MTLTEGNDAVLEEAAIRDFERRLRGRLIHPGDESYDEARNVWNGAINRFPVLIVRCAGVADVIAAVRFARDTGLPVAVRGGGTASLASRHATAASS